MGRKARISVRFSVAIPNGEDWLADSYPVNDFVSAFARAVILADSKQKPIVVMDWILGKANQVTAL